MLDLEKLKLAALLEPSNFIRRVQVKVLNDWPHAEMKKKRLLINHDYKFIYCPIHKNASTSMMAMLMNINKQKSRKNLDSFNSLQVRLYVELNFSLANYTWKTAEEYLNSNYFKFVIVRNPWARLVSTYTNYFIRLPMEKGIVTEMAKRTYQYIYGAPGSLDEASKVTFEQFVRYVFQEQDSDLNVHCIPQTSFMSGIDYDYIAKLEKLNEDLDFLEKKLCIPIRIKRLNKTNYSHSPEENIACHNLTPQEIGKLVGGIPDYKYFYNSELVELVGMRYSDDIEKFNYSFDC